MFAKTGVGAFSTPFGKMHAVVSDGGLVSQEGFLCRHHVIGARKPAFLFADYQRRRPQAIPTTRWKHVQEPANSPLRSPGIFTVVYEVGGGMGRTLVGLRLPFHTVN